MISDQATICFGLGLAALSGPLAERAPAQGCDFEQVDVSTGGVQGNGWCHRIRVSGDGRFVAFDGTSSNLVPGDLNGWPDVFVRDLQAGTTEIVSVGSVGQQGNGYAEVLDISGDGRFVVFLSLATNLDPLDPEDWADIYVRDRQTGTTELISVQLNSTPSVWHCTSATISADGRYVAFESADPNIVAGDNNGWNDVFLRDRLLGTTVAVSVSSSGEIGDLPSTEPSISADGTRIAFLSVARNFYPMAPTLDYWYHVFVRDVVTGLTTPVDVTPTGRLGNQGCNEVAISPDGSTVVFHSQAGDLLPGGPTKIGFKSFVRELGGFPMQALTFADGRVGGDISSPELSWDGRLVAFESGQKYWVAKDLNPSSDVFLQDRTTGITNLVSTNGPAQPANASLHEATLSDDGRVIAFLSQATTLVQGTTPSIMHAFVRICDSKPGLVFCYPTQSLQGCLPWISGQGQPSASASSGHTIDVHKTLNDQLGLFVYGTSGSQAIAFANGFFCLQGPLTRLPAQPTGGSLPPTADCTGSLQLDFNAQIATGLDPLLTAGTSVYVQSWTRDPSHPAGAILSDALAFVVGP
jgi:Tol biopolymer transport system component